MVHKNRISLLSAKIGTDSSNYGLSIGTHVVLAKVVIKSSTTHLVLLLNCYQHVCSLPAKRAKTVKSYLDGRPVEDEKVGETIDWKINDVNVSKKLRECRRKSIDHAGNQEASNLNLSSIEELSLNSIFYITKSKHLYEIEDDVWDAMLDELKSKYQTHEDEKVNNFQVEKIRPIYKEACKDLAEARQMSKKLLGDTDIMKTEQMANVLIHFVSVLSKQNVLEDMFTKKYVTPLLSAYFIETEHLEVTGCGEESQGSKDRKVNKYGRKPDMMYKAVVGENTQNVFFMKIKSKEQSDILAHPDFIKLANLMKDEVDRLLLKNFAIDVPIYGMLVEGRHAFVVGMDLCYTGIYRLFNVTSFCFPTSPSDLAVLDHAFDSMFRLMDLVDDSAKKAIDFLKKTDKIKTPPLRRQLYVKSFQSHKRRKSILLNQQ